MSTAPEGPPEAGAESDPSAKGPPRAGTVAAASFAAVPASGPVSAPVAAPCGGVRVVKRQDCATSLLAQAGVDDAPLELTLRLGLTANQHESHIVEGLDRPPRALPLRFGQSGLGGRAERRGVELQDDERMFCVPRPRAMLMELVPCVRALRASGCAIRNQDFASLLAQVGVDNAVPEVILRLGLIVKQLESNIVKSLDRPPRALPLRFIQYGEAGPAERRGVELQDDERMFRDPRDRHRLG